MFGGGLLVILFSDVSKEEDGNIVLKNVSFHIKKDEFVLIFNKNERILKIIRKLLCLEEKPDKGLIRLFNKNR